MPRHFCMAVWQENVIRRDIIDKLPENLKNSTELFSGRLIQGEEQETIRRQYY